MSLSSEICRLQELRASGVLDDRAYARAKHRLLRDERAARSRATAEPRRWVRGVRRNAD